MKKPFLVAACLAVLSLPPAAQAAEGGRKPPHPSVFFALEGSEGYSVFVVSIGNWVAIETQRKRVTAAYAVRAKVSADRVEARFGSLGRIDVAFESLLGRPQQTDPCKRPLLEIGIFRGRIDFRGENGYTRVKEARTIGFLFKPNHSGAGGARGRGAAPRRDASGIPASPPSRAGRAPSPRSSSHASGAAAGSGCWRIAKSAAVGCGSTALPRPSSAVRTLSSPAARACVLPSPSSRRPNRSAAAPSSTPPPRPTPSGPGTSPPGCRGRGR